MCLYTIAGMRVEARDPCWDINRFPPYFSSLFLFTCTPVSVWVDVTCVGMPRDSVRFPRTGVRDSCEVTWMCVLGSEELWTSSKCSSLLNHLSSLPTLFVETESVNLELTDEAGLTGQQASGILLFIASLVTKVQLLCTGQVLPRSLGSELTSSCQQTLDEPISPALTPLISWGGK